MDAASGHSLQASTRLSEIESLCRAKDEIIRNLQRELQEQVGVVVDIFFENPPRFPFSAPHVRVK